MWYVAIVLNPVTQVNEIGETDLNCCVLCGHIQNSY